MAGITDILRIAAGSLSNLVHSRVLRKPAPLARTVDGDWTSWRYADASKIAEFSVIETHLSCIEQTHVLNGRL